MRCKLLMVGVLILIMATSSYGATITVSAAASLKDVMGELEKVYEKENPNEKIMFNFGGSGALQQQIENGAPVDVFISAAEKQINELEKKNLLLKNSKKDLLMNEVVLIVPKDSKILLKNYTGLTDAKIKQIGIGEIKSVPVGQYSLEIFNSLGIFDKISSKLIYGKDVRAVLSWVESGNVDAGIVYKTDAMASDKVRVICSAPKGSHAPVVYPVAIISDSKFQTESKKFTDFLKSKKAKELFVKFGFTPIK